MKRYSSSIGKYLTKIRKLFSSPDPGAVQQGVEIARIFEDLNVFLYFLDGVEVLK